MITWSHDLIYMLVFEWTSLKRLRLHASFVKHSGRFKNNSTIDRGKQFWKSACLLDYWTRSRHPSFAPDFNATSNHVLSYACLVLFGTISYDCSLLSETPSKLLVFNMDDSFLMEFISFPGRLSWCDDRWCFGIISPWNTISEDPGNWNCRRWDCDDSRWNGGSGMAVLGTLGRIRDCGWFCGGEFNGSNKWWAPELWFTGGITVPGCTTVTLLPPRAANICDACAGSSAPDK